MHTKFEAVHPSSVLYNLFFKDMKKTNEELALEMGIEQNDFNAMMRDEILFDKKTDQKIAKYLDLPDDTLLKMQNYYINFNKLRNKKEIGL
jgi:plasmid maintenance system antidote protein VapI